MKIPENIKKTAIELFKTLSNENSFFSSKRIERMFLMGSVFTISIGTWIYLMVQKTLTATDATIITVPLLTAAGYSAFRTYQDKKLETNTENETNSNSVEENK